MPKHDVPKKLVLTAAQAEDLKARVSNKKLNDQDVETLLGLLSFNLWLQEQLSRAKLSIKRLQGLFGFKRESNKASKPDEPTNENQNESIADETSLSIPATPNYSDTENKNVKNWDPSKNHGRYSAGDYTGCPVTPISFDKPLEHCPDCAQYDTTAKLYSTEPQFLIQLDSAPLVHGTSYELARVRCSVCQTYFTASLPEELNSQSKYSYRSKTSIAIVK